MRHQVNRDRFFQTFQGTNQYVMSYLVKEVLSQQSPLVQTFLLRTSLLNRFCVPLCDALLAIENPDHDCSSQEILAHLLQNNLFLLSLDNQGEWFRYHHLFSDLLRHQLQLVASETLIGQLHLQASAWLAAQDYLAEALDHAFLAADMDRAAQIVVQARYRLMNETQWQQLELYLRRFPQAAFDQYPDLLMAETWLFYHHGQYTKLPAALSHLEQLISRTAMLPEKKDYLLGEMSALRSLLAFFAVDVACTIMQAEQALEQTPPELWIVRILARLTLGGAQQMEGHLSSAYNAIYRGFDDEPVRSAALRAALLVTVCNIDWIAADLKSLRQHAAQVINLSQSTDSPEMLGYGHYNLGTAAYHQNDLSAAAEHFTFVTQHPYAAYGDSFASSVCGLALTFQALDQEQAACDAVDAALAFLLATGNAQLLFMMKAFQAELSLRQQQLSSASQWASQLDPVPPLAPIFRIYSPHMTLVKVWLAENTDTSRSSAAALLAQLTDFLERTHNNTFLIEALALRAMLYQIEGHETEALAALEKALTLALPGVFIRLFVDLGTPMSILLQKIEPKNGELAAYRDQILNNFGSMAITPGFSLKDENGSEPLVEPLTDREMDVLIRLKLRRTDKEIAAQLVISRHTVRSHTKSIY